MTPRISMCPVRRCKNICNRMPMTLKALWLHGCNRSRRRRQRAAMCLCLSRKRLWRCNRHGQRSRMMCGYLLAVYRVGKRRHSMRLWLTSWTNSPRLCLNKTRQPRRNWILSNGLQRPSIRSYRTQALHLRPRRYRLTFLSSATQRARNAWASN